MPSLRWTVSYFDREPKTEFEAELEKIRDLRELLDLDAFDANYTLEELQEMYDERDAKDLDPEG